MLRLTTSIPTPRPETSVTTSAVENGREDQVPDLGVGQVSGAAMPPRAPDEQLVARQPLAVVAHLDDDRAALVRAASVSVPVGLPRARRARPASRCRGRRALRTRWVSGIGDLLDQALVELGRPRPGDEVDLLPSLPRVAQHAREAAEDDRHRDHADRHHRPAGRACCAPGRPGWRRAAGTARCPCAHVFFRQHGLRDHGVRRPG